MMLYSRMTAPLEPRQWPKMTESIPNGMIEIRCGWVKSEIDFAIFHLESGFFATQGNCLCAERTLLSEADVEGEELECPSCGNTFSIVSGDPISDLEQNTLRIYEVTEEDGNLYLNL